MSFFATLVTYAILIGAGHMIAMRNFLLAKVKRLHSVDLQMADNGPNIITERWDREADAYENTARGIWAVCAILGVIGLCHLVMILMRLIFQ